MILAAELEVSQQRRPLGNTEDRRGISAPVLLRRLLAARLRSPTRKKSVGFQGRTPLYFFSKPWIAYPTSSLNTVQPQKGSLGSVDRLHTPVMSAASQGRSCELSPAREAIGRSPSAMRCGTERVVRSRQPQRFALAKLGKPISRFCQICAMLREHLGCQIAPDREPQHVGSRT